MTRGGYVEHLLRGEGDGEIYHITSEEGDHVDSTGRVVHEHALSV